MTCLCVTSHAGGGGDPDNYERRIQVDDDGDNDYTI